MNTVLPVDENSNAIPVMRLRSGGAHMIASDATAARNAQAFDAGTSVVSVYATEDVYITFGDENVTATSADHFFPAGIYYDFAIGDEMTGRYSHISVLQVSTSGNVYVSEKI